MSTPLIDAPHAAADTEARGRLRVVAKRPLARDIVAVTLARPDGTRLPNWAPGAHIDIELPDGRRRQYSLCGDRWDAHTYRIAVQREPDGRGGSRYIHDELAEGDLVGFGGPRNNFRLAPAAAYLFVAGGIGITPILPMIAQAELLGVPWRLLYLVRSRDRVVDLGLGAGDPRVTIHCADEVGRADLDAWAPADPGVRVWACGPERLLAAVEAWNPPPGGHRARIERFTARGDDGRPSTAFEVVAARSGVTTRVRADESIVQALGRAGVGIITSCAQGVCGTCETDVVAGEPDHRDALLDDAERAAGRLMFPCVSRCRGERLVLDV